MIGKLVGEDEESYQYILARPVNQYYLLSILAHIIKGQTLCSENATPSLSPDRIRTDTKDSARVLVVDDNEFCRNATARMLLRYGVRVKTCESGMEALGELRAGREDYDVAVVDYRMPEMDGIELIREIRLHEKREGTQQPMQILRIGGTRITVCASVVRGPQRGYLGSGDS